jgi:glycosyltransferase involved in cell wall biosynthesis
MRRQEAAVEDGHDMNAHGQEPWSAISARLGVLQVLPDMMSNGPARAAVDMAAAVMAAGGRAVVASGGGPLVVDLLRCGATHILVPFQNTGAFARWANVRRLMKAMRQYRIAIVHARVPDSAWLARKAAQMSGAWFVVTCHGNHETSTAAARRRNAVMAYAERVIAVSETVAEHLRVNYPMPSGRLSVVPPGIDLQRFDPTRVSAERIAQLAQQWRMPDGVPVIMLPGRLTRSRGHRDLIESIANLGSRELHCVFVAEDAGNPSYRRELVKLAQRNGLDSKLVIVDDCHDMPAAYMLADVIVYARADGTGFARVVGEAQAMGRPIVAYDSALLREQVGDGRMTWLVPPGNGEALGEAVAEALDLSAAERQTLAPEANAVARQRYNRATAAAAMIEVYLELLTEAQAA